MPCAFGCSAIERERLRGERLRQLARHRIDLQDSFPNFQQTKPLSVRRNMKIAEYEVVHRGSEAAVGDADPDESVRACLGAALQEDMALIGRPFETAKPGLDLNRTSRSGEIDDFESIAVMEKSHAAARWRQSELT